MSSSLGKKISFSSSPCRLGKMIKLSRFRKALSLIDLRAQKKRRVRPNSDKTQHKSKLNSLIQISRYSLVSVEGHLALSGWFVQHFLTTTHGLFSVFNTWSHEKRILDSSLVGSGILHQLHQPLHQSTPIPKNKKPTSMIQCISQYRKQVLLTIWTLKHSLINILSTQEPRLWRSWQGSRFRHQRSGVGIPTSAIFRG